MAHEAKAGQQESGATHDVDSAAAALAGLLGDDLEFKTQEIEASKSETALDDDEDDGADSHTDDEDFDQEDESDAGEEDVDEDGDDDADSETEDSDTPTYKVKVDGQEIEVTLEEALSGYQRRQTFTKRTQQLAQERQALRQQETEVAQARQDYLDRLDVVKAALAGTVNAPDWEKLKQDNPEQYAQMRVAFQERQDQIGKVEAEIKRVRDEQQAAYEAQRDALVAAEAEKLEAAIPEWVADPDVAAEEKGKIANFTMQTYGFSADDVGKVIDHRLVLLLRDAMQFHDLKTKGKRAKEEIRGKRRKSPSLHPGSRDARKTGKSKKNPARARLAKTGSVDDAAATLLGMDFD